MSPRKPTLSPPAMLSRTTSYTYDRENGGDQAKVVDGENHVFTLAALLVIAWVMFSTLSLLSDIFIPFIIAFFLCQLLEPIAMVLGKPRNCLVGWLCRCGKQEETSRTSSSGGSTSGSVSGGVVAGVVVSSTGLRTGRRTERGCVVDGAEDRAPFRGCVVDGAEDIAGDVVDVSPHVLTVEDTTGEDVVAQIGPATTGGATGASVHLQPETRSRSAMDHGDNDVGDHLRHPARTISTDGLVADNFFCHELPPCTTDNFFVPSPVLSSTSTSTRPSTSSEENGHNTSNLSSPVGEVDARATAPHAVALLAEDMRTREAPVFAPDRTCEHGASPLTSAVPPPACRPSAPTIKHDRDQHHHSKTKSSCFAHFCRVFAAGMRRSSLVLSDIVIITLCIGLLGGVAVGLVYGLKNELQNVGEVFQKYLNGPKIQMIKDFLERHGIHVTDQQIIDALKGPLQNFIASLLEFLTTSILMVMILGFLLLGSLTHSHPAKPKWLILQKHDGGLYRLGADSFETVSATSLVGDESSYSAGNGGGVVPEVSAAKPWTTQTPVDDQHGVDLEAPPANAHSPQKMAQTFLVKIKRTIQGFVVLKTLVSLLEGIMMAVLFVAVGVDFWFVFTILTFLMNYIPTVGGIIALVGPCVFAFLDPDRVFSDVVLIAVVGTVIHTICGNMIEPALFGSSFDLHPIIVLFCLVVWSVLWGVTGAILSVPLTSCIKLGVQPFRRENVYAMIAFYALEFSLPSDKAWGDLERRRAEKRAEKWEAEMRRGRGFPRAGGGGGGGERGGGRGGGRVEVTAAALAEQARRCWEPKMGVISGEHKLRKNSANLATKDDTGFNGGDWMPEQIKKSAGLKGGPGGDSPPGRIAKNSINATPPDSTIPADSSARRAEDTSVADSTAKETAPTTQQHERRESIVPPLPEKAPSKTNSRRLRGLSDGDVIGMLGRGKGSGAGTSTPLSGGGASFSGRTVIPRPLFPPGGNSGRGMTGGNWNTSTSEDHTTTQGRRTGSETFSEGGEGGGGGLRKSLSSSTSVGELQPASSWRRREVVRGVVSSEEPRPTDSRRGGQSSSSRVSRAGSPSFGRASGRVSREAGRKSEDSTTSNRPSWQN